MNSQRKREIKLLKEALQAKELEIEELKVNSSNPRPDDLNEVYIKIQTTLIQFSI